MQISIKFKKIILKCFVLSVAREYNGKHFVRGKGNKSCKTGQKVYNFRIKSDMCN